jgi:hypothetical protein
LHPVIYYQKTHTFLFYTKSPSLPNNSINIYSTFNQEISNPAVLLYLNKKKLYAYSKENSPTGEPIGEDRGVVALMRSEFLNINSD